MDLKQRLAQLDRLTRRPGPAATGAATASLGARLDALGLARREGSQGPVWVRDLVDELPARGPQTPDFSGFFPRDGGLRLGPEDLLFLDAETTGLAGGTGTIAFLVGTSRWERGRLLTRQFFLPDPGHEAAMLAELALAAAGRRVAVTFNGTVFDLPLLRTRALITRAADPCAGLGGWDLLVAGRRLWGRSFADCRQQTLEAEVCGLRRGPGDIEGARIPQAWFDFLGGAGGEQMNRVLTHNHRDMLGMAELFLRVWDRAEILTRPGGAHPAPRWQEAWSLARICDGRQQRQPAGAWIALALDLMGPLEHRAAADPDTLQRFWRDALRIGKRAGRHGLVERLLDDALRLLPEEQWLHREAAILYEHRLYRLDKALEHAFCSGERARVVRLQVKHRRDAGVRDRGGSARIPAAGEEP